MNELEQKLLEILEKSISVAEKTGEFVMNQAPDLLREFYAWQILNTLLVLILCTILFLLAQKSYVLFSKKELAESDKRKNFREHKGRFYKTSYSNDPSSEALSFSMAIKLLSYVLVVPVCFQIYKILFISFAPKMYLVQYLLNLKN